MKRLSYILIVIISLFVCLPSSIHAAGAATEPGFHPYISIQEEYNDNINLTPIDKKDDYITTVKPGLKYINSDPTFGVDFDYNLGLVYYGKETENKYVSHNGSLNAKYLTKEHFNFYLKESFIRSDEQREREYFTTTEENKYVLSTLRTRTIYWRNVVAPTVEYQFGPENRAGINYRNNIYRTESTVGNDSREDYINPFFDYWFNQKNGIHLEYGYTIGEFKLTPDMTGHRANGRYTNRFSPKTSIFGEYTFSQRNFDPPSTDYNVHEPSVGITYAFSPTFNVSAQAGYFWKQPEIGEKTDGLSYKASITNLDVRTTYILSLQGGYTEDYFTSEDLGFRRYHRLTGSIKHFLEQKTSVGVAGNVERAEFDEDRKDWIWGASGTLSHTPLKWLTLTLEISHRESNSNIDSYDYKENRGIITITATY